MKNLLVLCIVLIIFQTNASSQCGYQLVWEDNFTGNTLDLSNWSYQTGGGGWGNNELQNYTTSNTTVQNGVLKITAKKPANNYYTSSRIRTKDLADFKYGKLEARIKLPQGQGIWPAFWMMPTHDVYGGWPTSGEIDIMEYLGHQTNRVHGTTHYGIAYNNKGSSGNSYTLPNGNFTSGFHVFGIEWTENNINWYVDGNLFHQVDNFDVAPYTWPFNEEFHFILNLAVGGQWPGYPDATTVFPQTMEVDYVRAYQQTADFEIAGNQNLAANSTNTYSTPILPNATYTWSIPSCATLVSGQGTNEITVNWGSEGGEISVVVGLACSTINKTIAVGLSDNFWTNSGFEFATNDWITYFANGGSGTFNASPGHAFMDNHGGCLSVNSTGNNFWDVQFRHDSTIPVIGGQTYYLSFYAKADQNNSQIRIDFRNTSNNISTANWNLQLSDTWTLYEYQYTPSFSISDLAVDFNHSFETGLFCYDEIVFSESNSTTTSICPTDNLCANNLTLQNTQIEDNTYQVAEWIDAKSIILNGQDVHYRAGHHITLNAGFDVQLGADFSAEIEACNEN